MEEKEESDDEQAAVALAAVAAAAVANHKSPVAAAKEAREMMELISSPAPSTKPVHLDDVKLHLRNLALETSSNFVTDKLCQGHNDALLQVMLRFEYFDLAQESNSDKQLAKQAAKPLENALKRIEGAYESILDLLPDSEHCLPDLLPPCNLPNGDLTVRFFQACNESEPADGSLPTASSTGTGSTQASPTVATNDPPEKSSEKSVLSVFKRNSKLSGLFRKKQAPVETIPDVALKDGEYLVRIEREMLGLTVENVLERTVVRTVLPGGPAKKAGAKIGSLITAIGNVETKFLTHFETIDELRQANRPLIMKLKVIPPEALRGAREEMGRLIQGSGFGALWEQPLPKVESFTTSLRTRLQLNPKSKKEESILNSGMKLIWILTLLCYGVERERKQDDASRSIAKVLVDYIGKIGNSEKQLLLIGDVLQRTRSFLADHTSAPAAILRGEIISFLCDVLDLDTEMELSEEGDLGSAGSLLKLIVLNCDKMQTPIGELADSESEEEGERDGRSTDTDGRHTTYAGNRFLAVVHRLAASKSTSARISACSLGPVLWGHLDFPHQLQLRGVITRALHDVEVAVRKSTATVLHEIAELVFDSRAVPWLVLMCERAMTDPEPQLRSAAMTLTWHLAEHLPNAFYGDARQGSRFLRRLPNRDDPLFADVYLLQCKLLPVATRLAEDRSPSVRLAVAAQCDRLCDALGDHWSSVVIDVLLGLLSDSDERVRCEAVSCVPRLAEIVLNSNSSSELSVLEALVPSALKMQKDQCSSVRVALAAAAGELLTLLVNLQQQADEEKYKSHIDERLIPMVQVLLNDADPEVTSASLRAVTNATRTSHSRTRHMSVCSFDDDSSHHSIASTVFYPVLSEAQVLRLLPTLSKLSSSRQWRVRQSAVEIVPALLSCTTNFETREQISIYCKSLMQDPVDAVRKTAAECFCGGLEDTQHHSQWVSDIVVPAIRECQSSESTKQRLLSLKMIQIVLLNPITQPIRESLVQVALSLQCDPVANVRLNVGKCLEVVVAGFDDPDVQETVTAMEAMIRMEKQSKHTDPDVVFFAKSCLTKATAVLEERRIEVTEAKA